VGEGGKGGERRGREERERGGEEREEGRGGEEDRRGGRRKDTFLGDSLNKTTPRSRASFTVLSSFVVASTIPLPLLPPLKPINLMDEDDGDDDGEGLFEFLPIVTLEGTRSSATPPPLIPGVT
jgi:hypothetical protein